MGSSMNCIICGELLVSQKEKDRCIYSACRHYGLLNGIWPQKNTASVPAK